MPHEHRREWLAAGAFGSSTWHASCALWILPLDGVARRAFERRRSNLMLSGLLWLIVVLLLLFWIFGLFVGNLGQLVWIALVVAIILAIYDIVTRGRATY